MNRGNKDPNLFRDQIDLVYGIRRYWDFKMERSLAKQSKYIGYRWFHAYSQIRMALGLGELVNKDSNIFRDQICLVYSVYSKAWGLDDFKHMHRSDRHGGYSVHKFWLGQRIRYKNSKALWYKCALFGVKGKTHIKKSFWWSNH